jgi:hypothetical protein
MSWSRDDDALSDSEEDDAFDEGDEPATIRCSSCRAEMLEDAVQCPACGMSPSREEPSVEGKPLWVMASVVVCLVIVLAWLAGN